MHAAAVSVPVQITFYSKVLLLILLKHIQNNLFFIASKHFSTCTLYKTRISHSLETHSVPPW